MNRQAFFSAIRHAPFHGVISASQVQGIELVLDEWDRRRQPTQNFEDLHSAPVSWLAYMLATDYHETAHTCRPIEEYGKGHGHPYGQPDPVTHKTYYGRGLVQLTWKSNYEKLGKLLSVDLLNKPELALSPSIATQIMFEGMIRGLFSGHGLADYLKPAKTDYLGARHIINGTDRAGLIEGYAEDFEVAIRGAQA